MNTSINAKAKELGKTLFCLQTQSQVTITEYANDFWTGTERFEGFRVVYPNGMSHIISCDRVNKDYLLFEPIAHESFIPDFVYDSDPSLEGFISFRMAA